MNQNLKKIFLKFRILSRIYYRLTFIKGYIIVYKSLAVKIIEYKKNSEKPVFFIFSPEHGNLGDHAIALSTVQMLKECKINFFEITCEQLVSLNHFKMLRKLNKSLILFNGGGNLGTLWPTFEELLRQTIIKNNNSQIIVLPNTIYYSEDENGIKSKEQSEKIYNSHKRLLVCVREQNSFDCVKELYNNVMLIPDMVLALDCSDYSSDRKGCILSLRNDLEKTLSDEETQQIIGFTSKYFRNVSFEDNVINKRVSLNEREQTLAQRFSLFGSSELVITDRLHGMIFCAITCTPCIVVSSKSYKLQGCYEWIKNLDYIKFIDNINDIEKAYLSIPAGEHHYSNSHLQEKFNQLKSVITQAYNNL